MTATKAALTPEETFALAVQAVLAEIKDMLLERNRAYGNSALNPLRVFSRATRDEQLRVRIDDKLSRLARGGGANTEDTVNDLIGYLVLLKIAQKENPE